MRCLLILLAFLLTLMTGQVMAADLAVRINDHRSVVRVVFEWPGEALPGHKVRVIDDRTIEVSFDAAADLEAFQSSAAFPEIVDLRRLSESGANLKLWVMLGEGGLYRRDLQVGQRLILDLGQSSSLRAAAARVQEAERKQAAQSEKPLEKTMEAAAPAPVEKPPPAVPPAPVPVTAAPIEHLDWPASGVFDPKDPPILTLGSTAAFGLAAFVAFQTLWVVIDDPDFIGTPKFSGQGIDRLPPLERSATKDATIFKMKLPKGVTQVRGEGGDLLWRIVFASPKEENKPLAIERREENGSRRVVIPVQDATKIVELSDEQTGASFRAITVRRSTEFLGNPRRYAEFSIPKTPVGIALIPMVDDLTVTTGEDEIIIMRPHGLSVTSNLDSQIYKPRILDHPPSTAESEEAVGAEVKPGMTEAIQQLSEVTGQGGTPLFRFDRWSMGGEASLISNETTLIADLSEKKTVDRASGLMNIGKMYLANDRGGEAAGYFRMATEAQPGLAETPEFLALRGAAYALNGQFDLAYEDLRNDSLDIYPDINLWRAYTLAHLQDWQQAAARMGKDLSWARQYPDSIALPMTLTFAEIALRAGAPKDAEKILSQMGPLAGDKGEKQPFASALMASVIAQLNYLQGETARQTSKKDEARKLWSDLAKGKDDKYRVRARLAMTVLDYEEGKTKQPQAIDQLESLRFAWRGDEVEAAINARLGEIYLDSGDYLRGLNALKEAASLAPDTDMGRRITVTMADSFRSLFIGDKVKKIDPLDAITVYEKFSELIPAGPEANRLSLSLVDRLMEVDLLDRAAKVLQDLVDHRLQGDQRVEVALRLAATHLLNRQPQLALNALNRAGEMLAGISNPETLINRKRELALLRARAQYQAGQVDSALSTLSGRPEDIDVLRARADVAWQTGRWGEASTALEKILAMTPITQSKPPTETQAELVRNLAVATNLAGDRAGLAQLRSRYEQAMMQTKMAGEFDVITRERQTPTLADRDTLNRLVAEVDMFGNFLNSYRQSEKPVEEKALATSEKTPETVAAE